MVLLNASSLEVERGGAKDISWVLGEMMVIDGRNS